MRVLLTGATSFTGMWFAKSLARNGHSVVAVLRRSRDDYADRRAERLANLAGACEFVWNAPFGTAEFLDSISRHAPFDMFCHHAAEVNNYKSPDFDVAAAVAANTRALPLVLDGLHRAGCRKVVLTGSVFEAGEGTGSMPLRAISPYGNSKTLTAQIFQEEIARRDIALGKFVIPNPFGPYEEPRFTEYLMRCWKDGKTARINTPLYVRDNIPVTLLAAAYAEFAEGLPQSGFSRLNPSFYVETQGAFARRFAGAMGSRLKLSTRLEEAEQREFPEPEIRVNTDRLNGVASGWSEEGFWDDTACYYARLLELAVQ